jgi:hypothetical protein
MLKFAKGNTLDREKLTVERENNKKKTQSMAARFGANDEMEEDQHQQVATSLPELNLGQYTDAGRQFIHGMRATSKTIVNLSREYSRHIVDIEKIVQIREQNKKLHEQCLFKDKKIKEQMITIQMLRDESREHDQMIAEETECLVHERNQLESERARETRDNETAAKRRKVEAAELKIKAEKALEEMKLELDKQYQDYKKNLEFDVKNQRAIEDERLVELEARMAHFLKSSKPANNNFKIKRRNYESPRNILRMAKG